MTKDLELFTIATAFFPDYVSEEIHKLSEGRRYYRAAGAEFLEHYFEECRQLIGEINSSHFITSHLYGILVRALNGENENEIKNILQYCDTVVKIRPDLSPVIGATINTQIPQKFKSM